MAIIPDFAPALPEIVLAVAAMALLMVGVFRGATSNGLVTGLSLVALLVVLVLVLVGSKGGVTFNGGFVVDPFARFMKAWALIGSALTVLMAADPARRDHWGGFEYPVLVLIATLGMLMMISANDLISLYVGLELQSLALYVVAAIDRDKLKSTEAGLKYFVLGALSSGMLLYGSSLAYGFTGHTDFVGIAAALKSQGGSLGLTLAIVFILAGLVFKISAVPFHMWTPDVYEGSPTAVTAFFAAAPKVAAMALIVRVVVGPFAAAVHDWQQILVFVSVASMLLGAFAAIGQRNIKRLMAYSSIGHMGYALVGLIGGNQEGVSGVAIYMAIYLIMTIGAFAAILAMRKKGQSVEDISDLAGMSRLQPVNAFFLAMILFSLAGIPPLAGFFAKLYVFMAAIKAGFFVVAVIGLVASVVSAFYYLRIVKIMYFDEPEGEALEPMRLELKTALGFSGLFVLLFVGFGDSLIAAAGVAAKTFF
ncbi:MAG: NADH-quinone oxidoreductase subunit NuoN [Ancalomicrobiaceae bacterium]|nr:NADH-quinone oxidoreductase subunit NuoN [Ancalomicrobiaceae bacterium]